jgi:hypothetical protein
MIKLLFLMMLPVIIPATFIGCRFFGVDSGDTSELGRENVKIWKHTPVWDLALAVKNEDTDKIAKIAKSNPELLNYQEPLYGETLLIWSVGVEKYNSTDTLLKCGANPNVTTPYGETALFEAAGYSWVDTDAKTDPKYVNLLFKYGADPNINYSGGEDGNDTEPGTSPLMSSIMCGIEKTKAFVDNGADINHKTKFFKTAAVIALMHGSFGTSTLDGLKYAHYLIVEKKAKVTDPYCIWLGNGDNPKEKFYPVDLLRGWTYPLGSEEYKLKMEIVKEFKRQGIDYWKIKIDKITLKNIKEQYPNTWKEYIKKY